jgi:hypothetical protein
MGNIQIFGMLQIRPPTGIPTLKNTPRSLLFSFSVRSQFAKRSLERNDYARTKHKSITEPYIHHTICQLSQFSSSKKMKILASFMLQACNLLLQSSSCKATHGNYSAAQAQHKRMQLRHARRSTDRHFCQHSQDSEEQDGRSEAALARMSRPVACMRWRRFGRGRGRRDQRTTAADELVRKEGGRLAAE